MPAYKSRTVVELARDIKAFLHFDVGLTRGAIPDPEQRLRQAQQKLEQTRKQLTARNRQLKQARKLLSQRDWQATRPSDEKPGTARTKPHRDEFHSDVEGLLALIPADFGSGCSVNKAYVLASLIREYDLKTTVEIGVYRGRSLFPQALAHRQFTGGVIYGVDPWSAAEAAENDNEELKEALERWANETDFQAIYDDVSGLRTQLGYEDHCILVRKTSADAAVDFKNAGMQFDMIHVDGNHDTVRVVEDVESYLPLLRPGGCIILDDVSWESVKPAYEIVESRLPLVFKRTHGPDDYAVFWNNSFASDLQAKKEFLENVASK